MTASEHDADFAGGVEIPEEPQVETPRADGFPRRSLSMGAGEALMQMAGTRRVEEEREDQEGSPTEEVEDGRERDGAGAEAGASGAEEDADTEAEADAFSDATVSDAEDAQKLPHQEKRLAPREKGAKRRRKPDSKAKAPAKKKGKAEVEELPRELLPGEIVWAKVPSYPWWPAQVQVPSEAHEKIRHKKTDVFVVFFGDQSQCSWMKRDKLEPWVCEDYSARVAKQTKGLQSAVSDALKAIGEDKAQVKDE